MAIQAHGKWVAFVRLFLATGRIEFLARAASICSHVRTRDLLRLAQENMGVVSKADIESPVNYFQSENKEDEAAVLSLLGIRTTAMLLEDPDSLDDEQIKAAFRCCEFARCLSIKHTFHECEAYFSYVLGTWASKTGRRRMAGELLRRSTQVYSDLADELPNDLLHMHAAVLNNYAVHVGQSRNYTEARPYFHESLSLHRQLEEDAPGSYTPEIARCLNNVAAGFLEMSDYSEATKFLDESLQIYRSLHQEDPPAYEHLLAWTLNLLADTLLKQRSPLATSYFADVLSIRRKLAGKDPERYKWDLGQTLNDIGNAAFQHNEFSSAHSYFAEALDIRRELAEDDAIRYFDELAVTLCNRANVYSAERNYMKACETYDEAVFIYRQLVEGEPHVYRADLAGVLNHFATALREKGDLEDALQYHEEASAIYRQLVESEPEVHSPKLVSCLNNFAVLLEELKHSDQSIQTSLEAVQMLEHRWGDQSDFWLFKGLAPYAYQRLLKEQIELENPSGAFRFVNALREGHARAIVEESSSSYIETKEELRRIYARPVPPLNRAIVDSLQIPQIVVYGLPRVAFSPSPALKRFDVLRPYVSQSLTAGALKKVSPDKFVEGNRRFS